MRLEHGAYSARDLAAAVHGRQIAGDPAQRLGRVSIDSRSLVAGDLFFAIVGQRDGHDFVGDAIARGAAGVVVQRPVVPPAATGPVVVEVADTLRALQDLGRTVRRASKARVVAITGSAGKTTTKDAIAAVLSATYRVVKNRGNLNNHLGLPISLVEMRECPDVAVMELGMNRAGEIRVLVGLAEPDVRVWTNVGDAHIGHFGSREAIADAKAEILEQATPSMLLVANADDPLVMTRARTFAGRTITFGTSAGADVRAVDLDDRGLAGTRATLVTSSGSSPLVVALPGRGHLLNALAAAAVGLELGVDRAAVVERLAALGPAEHRGVALTSPSGVRIFDDSYNASPAALMTALDALGRSPRAGRAVAVVGEMLELGEASTRLHEASGRYAAAVGVERLVTIGAAPAERLGAAAVTAGIPATHVTHVATSEEAAALLLPELRAGDLVLVKGSRGLRTEVVVARLMAGGA
jgi:UDP-N-acetylmuramoyl-tripeptide--D-alanyl-D-alanine ligase